MFRVLVVDDHAVVREGLKRILAEGGDIAVGEASDDREALVQLGRENYDVVVTDLSMPGRGGLELLDEVRRRYPGTPVVVLSVHAEDQLAMRALKAGASGYLTKETAPEELVKAVRRARAGGKYLSPAVAERLAFHVGGSGSPHDGLSQREFQVLQGLGRGRTVKEIASELSLSVKTVSTYRTRLLAKMGMKRNAELTAYAIRNGLVV